MTTSPPECPEGPRHRVAVTPHTEVPEHGPDGPVWRCETCGRYGAVLTEAWADLFPGEPLVVPLGRTPPGTAPPVLSPALNFPKRRKEAFYRNGARSLL
ncbi:MULTISPECIES: hypothetical protein [unclassified Kitasatospora]|uniref:hypothetical protein n=1 Tax=unclassified Kitasatospora TaxID=2633591 RepID=UPI0033F957B0